MEQTDKANLKAAGLDNLKSNDPAQKAPETEQRSSSAAKSSEEVAKLGERPDGKQTEAAIELQPETAKSVDASSAEAMEKHNERVDYALEKLNAENEAGHAKNMERIEAEAKAAQTSARPAQGKSNDALRNTPHIDPETGAKTWR